MFWLLGYFPGIPIFWIIAGILGGSHKGAEVAGAWGLICLFFIGLGAFIGAASRYSDTTKAGALAAVVGLAGPPIALISGGNGSAHGGDLFWIVFWFAVVAVAIKLLAKAGAWIKEKTDY